MWHSEQPSTLAMQGPGEPSSQTTDCPLEFSTSSCVRDEVEQGGKGDGGHQGALGGRAGFPRPVRFSGAQEGLLHAAPGLS